MSRLTLLHRDLSRRIESLKQIVEASQNANVNMAAYSGVLSHHQYKNVGDMHSIDLNPNTNQLIIKSTRKKTQNSVIGKPTITQRELDEGFESDVDTISLVSTESTISLMTKSRETDSANGSASSDSDDSETTKTQKFPGTTSNSTSTAITTTTKEDDIITEYFNLVNCVCYTDSAHPDILILVVASPSKEEETLIFKFSNQKELEAFHENFSTVKAVCNQKSSNVGCLPFNLLQRTDSDGMTHIRISRQDDYQEDYSSLISLPNIPQEPVVKPKFEKFATMGKPTRKRILKKSKSIEDFLDSEKPLRKIWNSAENILDIKDTIETKPKVPPRKGRKKGPAPPPPCNNTNTKVENEKIAQNRPISRSFTNLHIDDEDKSSLGLGNVFQGQFVRVQVDHTRSFANYPILNFKQKPTPEILKYEAVKTKNTLKPRNFDAFKFSDPKNLTGYYQQKDCEKSKEKEQHHKQSKASRGFSALKLYIPMYKSVKKPIIPPQVQPQPQQYGMQPTLHHNSNGNFTNRLFGMSSKLKEFGSLQSGCNPNKRYDHEVNPYAHPVKEHNDKFLGKLSRLGRSGSLGNLTLLAHNEKTQSNTLKSVIKKNVDSGRKFGRQGKKVTFSAYNTVQVV